MRAAVGRGSDVADGKGEVIGERAPQWAEPSVDEAQKCGLNQSNLMKLRFLRYTY